MTHTLIRQIEDRGYAVSVDEMPCYVEMHAVRLTGDEIPHVARCGNDQSNALEQCARALAEMVGIRPEG